MLLDSRGGSGFGLDGYRLLSLLHEIKQIQSALPQLNLKLWIPIFCRMFDRCLSTVLMLMDRMSAISLLFLPSKMNLTTSSSLGRQAL
jgi:hypothetical protein